MILFGYKVNAANHLLSEQICCGIGFFVALKLIACAQNDIPFDIDSLDEVLVKELTPPMFDMETAKLKSAGSTLMGLGYLVGRPIAPDQLKAMIVKFTPYPEHCFIGQRDGAVNVTDLPRVVKHATMFIYFFCAHVVISIMKIKFDQFTTSLRTRKRGSEEEDFFHFILTTVFYFDGAILFRRP